MRKINENRKILKIEYLTSGNIEKTEYSEDGKTEITKMITPDGNEKITSKKIYNDNGDLITLEDEFRKCEYLYFYDKDGNITSCKQFNPGRCVRTRFYDKFGNPTYDEYDYVSFKESCDYVTTYDENNRVVKMVGKESTGVKSVTTHKYDIHGNCISSDYEVYNNRARIDFWGIRFEYDEYGNCIRESSTMGYTKEYAYDLENSTMTVIYTDTDKIDSPKKVEIWTFDKL